MGIYCALSSSHLMKTEKLFIAPGINNQKGIVLDRIHIKSTAQTFE